MKKSISVSIPKPCHEKWQDFNPTTLGGFCGSCQKEVVDFSSWDEEKIKDYFKKAQHSTCGRFKPEQLKMYEVSATYQPNKASWWQVSLISLTLAFFSNNLKAQDSKKPAQEVVSKENHETIKGDVAIIASGPRPVYGIVRDGSGTPMPGVNVHLKEASADTTTNAMGEFVLIVPDPKPSDVLSFSFIGYTGVERSIHNLNSLDVVMEEDLREIGEVVITRYSFRGVWYRIKNVFR